ncbi:DUF3303 family protein [Streptomyces sp. NPDC002328]|uniref:DUF3303 family protein n=1 Tax=Streptomyces sp. NPDC002328 TaxID=3364642 RepID=UPI0036AA6952
MQPEAAYFGPLPGRRTAFLVLDMQDSSELPAMLEPFLNQLNADVEVFPVMDPADLRRG